MNNKPNHNKPSDSTQPIPKKRKSVVHCDLDEDLSSDGDFECNSEQDDRTWQPTESDLEEFEVDISQDNFENIIDSEINNAIPSTSSSEERISLITVQATRDEVPNEVESSVIVTEQIGPESSSCSEFKSLDNLIFSREYRILCKTKFCQ